MVNRTVDIIVPIYNAFDELKKCVDSLLRYVNLDVHKIVLINDKSTDDRIETYLNTLANKNLIIVNSEENSGFTGTVNKGMHLFPEDDVILLNSDTIVTNRWIEKLIQAAYSKENIATVTPLSNNATLCSVPDFMEYNRIPLGYSIDSFADLVENKSIRKYPEIPTAHGFCVYIKRSALDEVGYYDEVNFSRGYGEENDFSYRAKRKGLINILCDDTFIYHKGTSSFENVEKNENITKSEKYLYEHYPTENKIKDEYVKTNPDDDIRERIKNSITPYRLVSQFRKDVIIFGLGKRFEKNEMLIKTFFNIVSCIDNKQDKYFKEYNIQRPESIRNTNFDYVILLSIHEDEMKNQLLDMGVEEKRILNYKQFNEMVDFIYKKYESKEIDVEKC